VYNGNGHYSFIILIESIQNYFVLVILFYLQIM
jgi:hypothetical protein